jgi:hypothetical protein
MDPETVDAVTLDELERLLFRSRDGDGRACVVSAAAASHVQFGMWARSIARVAGPIAPWLLAERAAFVAWLRGLGVALAFIEPCSQDTSGGACEAPAGVKQTDTPRSARARRGRERWTSNTHPAAARRASPARSA